MEKFHEVLLAQNVVGSLIPQSGIEDGFRRSSLVLGVVREVLTIVAIDTATVKDDKIKGYKVL